LRRDSTSSMTQIKLGREHREYQSRTRDDRSQKNFLSHSQGVGLEAPRAS